MVALKLLHVSSAYKQVLILSVMFPCVICKMDIHCFMWIIITHRSSCNAYSSCYCTEVSFTICLAVHYRVVSIDNLSIVNLSASTCLC